MTPTDTAALALAALLLAGCTEVGLCVHGYNWQIVSVSGVGYFDSLHGQPGVAPNGIEIHPVMAMCFGRGCVLPDP